MSPRSHVRAASPAALRALTRIGVIAGQQISEERRRRRWSLQVLADRAGMSDAHVAQVEAGGVASVETYVRLMVALDLEPQLTGADPRRREARTRDEDLVHAAMGEVEARRLSAFGLVVGIDEPYQHYQFAGRADVVAWDLAARALLHFENRTRFPNVQESLGSYAAKRAYLGRALAERLGIPGGWRSETHVIAALWSSEVIHDAARPRSTLRALTNPSAWRHGGPVAFPKRPGRPAASSCSTRRRASERPTASSSLAHPRARGTAGTRMRRRRFGVCEQPAERGRATRPVHEMSAPLPATSLES